MLDISIKANQLMATKSHRPSCQGCSDISKDDDNDSNDNSNREENGHATRNMFFGCSFPEDSDRIWLLLLTRKAKLFIELPGGVEEFVGVSRK